MEIDALGTYGQPAMTTRRMKFFLKIRLRLYKHHLFIWEKMKRFARQLVQVLLNIDVPYEYFTCLITVIGNPKDRATDRDIKGIQMCPPLPNQADWERQLILDKERWPTKPGEFNVR